MRITKNKDFNNKQKFNSLELSKVVYKLLFINYLVGYTKSLSSKKVLSDRLISKNKLFSKTKMIRYCILTGRSRGSIRKLGGVSRVLLRDMLQLGVIPGYNKAVW
jgi:ribosomal protein S14